MKLTVIYDNDLLRKDLKPDWGFSCLVETNETLKVLFDTGFKPSILIGNMEKLGINPKTINFVVISHPHLDHTGGLKDFLRLNSKATVYVPQSFPEFLENVKMVKVKNSLKISENLIIVEDSKEFEQFLLAKTSKGYILITGCSHPGLEKIIFEASKFGKIFGVVGGFHGFNDFKVLENISFVCPCHCTIHKKEIAKIFPEKYVECGVGKVLEIV